MTAAPASPAPKSEQESEAETSPESTSGSSSATPQKVAADTPAPEPSEDKSDSADPSSLKSTIADLTTSLGGVVGNPGGRLPLLAAFGVLLALLLYYPVGAWRAHVIDDDAAFAPAFQNGGSLTAEMSSALIRREVDQHGWIANKPFFMPSAILDDMPNFQIGLIKAAAAAAQGMADGRSASQGSEAEDDLAKAADLLRYAPDVWRFDAVTPWNSVPSSDKQYHLAAQALENFDRRLVAGDIHAAQGPAAVSALIRRLAEDLDQSAANLEPPASLKDGQPRWRQDRAFWQAKGHAYGQFLILRAAAADHAALLGERGLTENWDRLLAELSAAAKPRPWMVLAGPDDSLWHPNHLSNEGFHLLRARALMEQITEALR